MHKVVASCALATALLAATATAGDISCPITAAEVGGWDQDTGSYADIWADGDIVFVGEFFDNKVHFFDVSDPANPNHFLEWVVGSPNTFSSAQDVKTGDGLLFIGLESDPNDGVEIVDIRDPFNPHHLSWIRTPAMSAVHNTFYDNGFLYVVNSSTPQVAVVDLTNFDPDNPPVRIEQNLWLIQVGNSFVHDITVLNGILYVSAWDSGLHLFDVSNVANQPPVFLGSGPGDSTHAAWATQDGRWVTTNEERPGGPLKLYEIIQQPDGVDVVLRDEVAMPPDQAFTIHNPIIVGTRVYVAWYQAGLRVFDIDTTQASLTDLGGFDTFGGGVAGFDGAWGVYPFLGPDRIVVSDLSNGLFVIKAQTQVSISFPSGLVSVIDPNAGALLTVQIDPTCGNPDVSTARVLVDDGSGGPFIEIPLNPAGGDLFQAQLPGAACGSSYSYYIAVDTLDGGTAVDPPGAPDTRYQAVVASSFEVFFTDDFESDNGWSTSSSVCEPAQTGDWERVDPNGTSVAPEDDYPGGEGTMCFVTQQGLPGDIDGAADVDGGPFLLVSPTIVIDGADAVVSYARWFASSGSDTLRVEVSTNGGQSWALVEQIGPAGTQWVLHEFVLSDVTPPGPTLNLRFVAEDCPNNSLTEAAIDQISVTLVVCDETDVTPPTIVHDDGVSTRPFTGYVDPRRESDNGVDLNQGIDTVTINFSEIVRNAGGAALDASAFSVTSTGAAAPTISAIDASANPQIVVSLNGPLTPGSWYTITADVEDAAGNPIADNGNQGPGVDETDRVDIAFLPADVDQSGGVNPLDLLKFKQFVNGIATPDQGFLEDFIDINRSGGVNPLDLLSFKQLINGVPPSTQVWSAETLDAPRP